MTMPAGRYYIGDLCYVLTEDEIWDEVCDLIFDETGTPVEGEFALSDGRRFACFQTAYGDGCYNDQFGNEYGVDSGTIGCVLLSDIPEIPEDMITGAGSNPGLGAVVQFGSPFSTTAENGTIKLGHIRINTGIDNPEDDEVSFHF